MSPAGRASQYTVFRTHAMVESMRRDLRLQGPAWWDTGIGPTLELAATRQDHDYARGIPWPPLLSLPSGTQASQATSTLDESLSSSWLHPSTIPSSSSHTKTSDDQHITLYSLVPRLLFSLLASELFSFLKIET